MKPARSFALRVVADKNVRIKTMRSYQVHGRTGGKMCGIAVTVTDEQNGFQLDVSINEHAVSASLGVGRACDQKIWWRSELNELKARNRLYESRSMLGGSIDI